MKLLILTTDFPPLVGGIGTFTRNLALGLRENGCSVSVLTTVGARGDECCKDFEVQRCAPRLNLKYLKIVPLLSAAVRYCLRDRPDKVLAMVWTHEGVAAYLNKKLTGVPYVLFANGSEILRHQNSWIGRLLMRWVFIEAEYVLPISEYARGLVTALGAAPSRTAIIHPPVAAEDFSGDGDPAEIDAKLDLKAKRVLLTTARLVRRKGHAQVLQVLNILRDKYPDLVYVMTGDGGCRKELEALARELGVTDRVRMPGFVSPPELRQLYRRADVYISPSTNDPNDVEGFGISFIEAGACGKPSIAGRSGGVSDAVVHGETGILVNPQDPGKIAAALESLLDDHELRKRMGGNARRRVLAELGTRRQGEKLKNILEGKLHDN